MAITKVYSVRVIGGAAVLSIICSFVGPLAALIQTIPGPVIGGISFLLYGMIGTSGLRILVDNHVDYSKNRNMILTSVIFVTGCPAYAGAGRCIALRHDTRRYRRHDHEPCVLCVR